MYYVPKTTARLNEMNCDDCGKLIDAYCLETLDDDTRESVERHLRGGCSLCRRRLESACLAIADETKPVDPPPRIKRELMDRVRLGRTPAPNQVVAPEHVVALERSARTAGSSRSLVGPLLAIAASVAGAVVGYQAVRQNHGSATNHGSAAPTGILPGVGAGVKFAMTSIPGTPGAGAAGGYVAFDQLTGQVHICATQLDPDTDRLHVWVTCADGSQHELGVLQPPVGGVVMQVFDLPPLPAALRSLTIAEAAGGRLEAGSGTEVLTVEIR